MNKLYSKVMVLLFSLSLLLGSATPAVAVDDVETETVRVGFYYIEGYNIMDENGTKSGYGYDVLQAMKLYNNWEYKYVGYDKGWDDIQQMILDDKVDMVISAVKTPEREKLYDFSKRSVCQSGACIMVKSGESKYVAGQYDDYNGMRIGFIKGSSQIESTADFAKEKGFTYEPVYYTTSEELEAAIHEGTEVDAIVTSNMRIISGTRQLEMYAMQDVHAMVKKGNEKLLKEIDYALEQISLYNGGLFESLYNNYYSAESDEEVFFSPEEVKYISECKSSGAPIKAALAPDMEPYSYYENGKPKGILYDIGSEISRRTGLKIEIVSTQTDAEYQKLIKDKAVDIVLSMRFVYDYAEKLGYTLTDPYYETDVSKVTHKDRNSEINTVATVRNSNIATLYLPTIITDEKIKYYDSVKECVDAVLHKDCDAVYLYTRMAQDAVHAEQTNSLTSVAMPKFDVAFAIGVRDTADAKLASIFEKAAYSLSDDDISKYEIKYTNYDNQELSLIGILYNNPLITIIIIALVLIVVFVLILSLFIARKRREEKQQNIKLQEALVAAEHANSAKSVFMSRMSHEIRTPLNAIIGYNTVSGDILAKAKQTHEYEQATEETTDYLAKSDIASKHLLTVINDVLDMSAIESGKIKIEHEQFNFKKMIADLDVIFSSQALEKGVNFRIVFGEEVENRFIGDQMRINQILTNLLSNAVKFTPPGGNVKLAINQHESENASAEDMATIHFEVEDTGIGMSEKFLSNIWTPFEQADASISRRFGGTGLGLSITWNFVSLMGGTIDVKSKEGQGSTFIVEMELERAKPQESAEKQEFRERNETIAEGGNVDFTGVHILVAEDVAMNMEIVKLILSAWNVTVDEAVNGKIAVEMFMEAPQGTYNMILMDVHMPELDGYSATREIRHSGKADADSIPIVAMTADAFAEDITEAMTAGMNDHISKPLNKEVLIDTLNKYVRR